MALRLTLSVRVRNTLAQEYSWDDALTPSETNPFPLAPVDEVKAGRVTPARYRRQNNRLRWRSTQVMVPSLLRLMLTPSYKDGRRTIVWAGWGLGRDAEDSIEVGVMLGFRFLIIDKSKVACKNAESFVKKHGFQGMVQVRKISLQQAWKKNVIDEAQVLAYYAGQFIQNQDYWMMDYMMRHFGRFLRKCHDCAVLLLHPRGEDNPEGKVEWKNTTPYHQGYLWIPLRNGSRSLATMTVLGKHWYYHQRYTFFLITVSAP